MKNLSRALLVCVVLIVISAGCIGQNPAPQPAAPVPTQVPTVQPIRTILPAVPGQLAGNWVVTTMAIQGGMTILYPTTEITLTFNRDGTIAGNGGCNNYFGSYNLTGETTPYGNGLVFGPIGSTQMYCQSTSQQEKSHFDLLQETSTYVVDNTQLTLTGSTRNVLIYQRPSTIVTPTYLSP